MSNLKAKATLAAAVVFSSFTIWAVHYQQHQERDNMYQGVLKDDERRREKMKQREEAFQTSQKKREIYESVQTVSKSEAS
ncbi:hypothetical protein CPB83DRAFT_892742 [Crepidotus variabilis]|uniref:Uncharacterized protein n=1 Tax=Crepidotus variabilis TaxID=179855 RepID=A0A9P6JS23_9AGAR|nr:hypothetical protein CPB83DRAFT_892742 [Crepidotus variabilis]